MNQFFADGIGLKLFRDQFVSDTKRKTYTKFN